MKISYEKHGVEGIENCLSYLAAFDSDDIDSDEFEIIGEDEEGRDGYADISIINLAEEACKALAAQRKRIAQLDADCAAHKAAEEVQIALRRKMESERDALAAHVDNVHSSMNDLIRESQGVAGLHKNGDVAEWESLLEGGHFEGWLLCLSEKPDTASLAHHDAELLAQPFKNISGCSDHSCLIRKPEGMGTNGGCRCHTDRSKASIIIQRLATLRDKAAGGF
ncbi:hypothetical protein ACQKFL_11775 [Vreelandella titanicae]|uniref:hypothetical protein n=1 Tax=Vreelandella titanicae TaxID=664683 RepID=UPI003CFD2CF3